MTQIKRVLSAFCLMALCHAAIALCDDLPKAEPPPDPCVTELTREKLDNPSERKTNFVRAEEPLPIPLNVKLLDQKFAATIGIELPTDRGKPFAAGDNTPRLVQGLRTLPRDDEFREFRSLQMIKGHGLLSPNVRERDFGNERLVHALERMLAQIPADRAPAKADREFFASEEIDKYVSTVERSRLTAGGGLRAERSFVVLRTTPQQAEERAQTLLTILDQGFSRPIQLRLLKQREAECQKLAEARQKRAAAQQQDKETADELQKYADFTADTLAGVRVQQFEVDADLAGLRAKIAAYDKLLAKTDRTLPRFAQLEDAKVAAGVELVSCEARRATIVEIIGKIKRRTELTEKQIAAANEASGYQMLSGSILQKIAQIDDDITAFGPVRLTDDQVTISEVEWVQRPERSGINPSGQP